MQAAAVNVILNELNGAQGSVLHPVVTHFDNQYYSPGSIIVKKRISVLEPRYKASKFSLPDILLESCHLPTRGNDMVLEKFSIKQTEAVAALVGLTIKNSGFLTKSNILLNEFGMKVNGADKVELSVQDVSLEKAELDTQKLSRAKLGNVNMEHILIKQALRYMTKKKLLFFRREKVLCLVVGCLRAANDFLIETKLIRRVKEEVKSSQNIGSQIGLSMHEAAGHSTSTTRSATVKKGTILAYEIRELHIVGNDGKLEIIFSLDGKGKLVGGGSSGSIDMGICTAVAADAGLASIAESTDEEKAELQEALKSLTENADLSKPSAAADFSGVLRTELKRLNSGCQSMKPEPVESGCYNVQLETMKRFAGACAPSIQISDGVIESPAQLCTSGISPRVEARISGLLVLSEAMSDLTRDITRKLIGYSAQGNSKITEGLQELVDRGRLDECTDEMAEIATDLGCTVTRHHGGRCIAVRVPAARASLRSAFVLAHCLNNSHRPLCDGLSLD